MVMLGLTLLLQKHMFLVTVFLLKHKVDLQVKEVQQVLKVLLLYPRLGG
jgi:hypothetical protein